MQLQAPTPPVEASPDGLATRARPILSVLELAGIGALVLLAAWIRWPYLWDIPRFTDETAEAAIGLRIARGEAFPLTNRDPYIGALWNYLLAAAFAISGPSLYTPRLLIAVLGTLTVIPAYLLGKSLAGTLGRGRVPCSRNGPCRPVVPELGRGEGALRLTQRRRTLARGSGSGGR